MRVAACAAKGGDRWPRPTYITGELRPKRGRARQLSISLVARRAEEDKEPHEVNACRRAW